MEEMRRLGRARCRRRVRRAPPAPAPEPAKRPLVDRINDPRVTRLVRAGAAEEEAHKGNPRRVSGFLKALDGETDSATKRRRERGAGGSVRG